MSERNLYEYAKEPLIKALKKQKYVFWMNEEKQNEVRVEGLSMEKVVEALKFQEGYI